MTKDALSAGAGTGIIGLSSRARACQASAAQHAERTQQAKHAQRPRRAAKGKQGAPLQPSKAAQSAAAVNEGAALGLPNGGADLSPRLRGGPQVGGAPSLRKSGMLSSYFARSSMQILSTKILGRSPVYPQVVEKPSLVPNAFKVEAYPVRTWLSSWNRPIHTYIKP